MARSRRPAQRWSEPCDIGVPAPEALSDDAALEALLDVQPADARLRTDRSVAFLRWRYGSEVVAYRAVRNSKGIAFVRARRRGAAREVVFCDVLAADASAERALVGEVVRRSDGDYVIRAGRAPGFVRLPRQGPILTWRGLREPSMPPLSAWNLTLGDIELF